jgi:hypothetical protein
MYHYDPNTALEELTEDATLPNPAHVRDMMLPSILRPINPCGLTGCSSSIRNFLARRRSWGRKFCGSWRGKVLSQRVRAGEGCARAMQSGA